MDRRLLWFIYRCRRFQLDGQGERVTVRGCGGFCSSYSPNVIWLVTRVENSLFSSIFPFPFHYFPVIFYDGRFCTKRACQCHCLFCTYKTRKPCSIHLIDTTSSRKYFSVIKHLNFLFFCYFFMPSDSSHQSCKNYIV